MLYGDESFGDIKEHSCAVFFGFENWDDGVGDAIFVDGFSSKRYFTIFL